MRRLFSIFTILAVVMLTASCQKELPDEIKNVDVSQGGQTPASPEISLDMNSMEFTAESGSRLFNIKANTSWTVSSNQAWCSVSPASGKNNGSVAVKVSENTSTSTRSATVTVKSDIGILTVKVTQNEANAAISLDTSSLEFTSSSGEQTFNIAANTSWTVSSDQAWCSVSPTSGSNNGSVMVKVSENTQTSERTATITVKTDADTRTVSVTQKQNNVIRVLEKEFHVQTEGGQFEIEFEHNVNDYEIDCDADWVVYEVKRTRGLSRSTISVSVPENKTGKERKAVLYIESESTGAYDEVTISQEYVVKEYFNMLTQDYTIDEKGGNISVSAQTNKTVFDIWPPEDSWAKLGELEFFTESFVITQHVYVQPFTEKAASRKTIMYMDDKTITITQYRNLFINESDLSMLRQEFKQLSVYTYDIDGVIWSSSDESVATVDANGLVKGVGVGTATITVTSSNGKYKDSITVTIEKPDGQTRGGQSAVRFCAVKVCHESKTTVCELKTIQQ